MTDDAGSLSNLRDLAMPPAIPFWPPAAGIWILAAALLAILAIVAWRVFMTYRANAYRRAALAEVDALEHALQGGSLRSQAIPTRVFSILKRTALAAFPRSVVASLSGNAFVSFLATSAAGFDERRAGRMAEYAYGASREPDANDIRAFIARCPQLDPRPPPECRRGALSMLSFAYPWLALLLHCRSRCSFSPPVRSRGRACGSPSSTGSSN